MVTGTDQYVDYLPHGAAEHRLRTGRPLVTLSYAQSLDGCLTVRQGEPSPVSGEAAMQITHRLRAAHDAILIGVGTVNLTFGAIQSVQVSVDDNVMEYITTEVQNGRLEIKTDPGVQLEDYALTVDITMTDLQGLFLSGVGNFAGQNHFVVDSVNISLSGVGNVSLDLETRRLISSLSGVGSLSLSGTTAQHESTLSGVAILRAFDLTATTCSLISSGVGDAEVRVSDALTVIISSIGSVYYKGHPTITQTISGTGRLVDAN